MQLANGTSDVCNVQDNAAGCLLSVTKVLVGGQSMSTAVHTAARAVMPAAVFIQTYACTEAGSSMTYYALPAPAKALTAAAATVANAAASSGTTAVGYTASYAQIRVVRSSSSSVATAGEPVVLAAVNTVGEIETRGPHVMRGYWRKPQATAAALRPLEHTTTATVSTNSIGTSSSSSSSGAVTDFSQYRWLRTGDLGSMSSTGLLYFAGRSSDIIKSGGESVHASEVEAALTAHPAVAEAAVYGQPDALLGERVAAAVVLRTAAISSNSSSSNSRGNSSSSTGASAAAESTQQLEHELLQWCRGKLSGYKCPKAVTVVAELPRNSSGKVMKHKLLLLAKL
jgi:acyl-CoA synthetase (AMP-forming)/AMP-acid ligase II